MRRHPSTLLVLLALPLLSPGPTLSDDDKDDRKWLDEVRPILTPEEEKVFERLKTREDREEFRKIFWARRDLDLETPENELQAEFEPARVEADRLYRMPGRAGSRTDCGRVFLLLGEPDVVRQDAGILGTGLRTPETWIYRDKPGRKFEGGQAVISFDDECRAPSQVGKVLDEVAASKVVQPALDYRFGEDGRLVKLDDLLLEVSPSLALVKSSRQDFPIAVDTSYLRVSDEATGVVGLLRGKVEDLPVEDRGGQKVVDVVVVTNALGEDGEESGWTEKRLVADVRPDGSFVVSFGVGLEPGTYTLKVGAVIEKNGAGSLVSEKIEVPDFAAVETAEDGTERVVPSIASILFVRRIEDIPPGETGDPTHPYAAFKLGQAQLVPYFGRDLHKDDEVSFFYLVYHLQVDPETEKADAIAVLSLLRDGKTMVARAPEIPIATPMGASAIGPVPLGAYEPGSYVAQLKVTDRLAKKTIVKNERFRIEP